MGRFGDQRAVTPLFAVLKDENADVRDNAAWALGKIGDARAVEPLTQALNDTNLAVQKSVSEALTKIEGAKANHGGEDCGTFSND